MENYTFEPKHRYFIERVTDFGDLTGTWKVFDTQPVDYVEYIAEMASSTGVWYYHNKYKGGSPGFPESYAKMPLTKEEFDTNIKPHVVNMKKDENEMKDERKAAGWIIELVARTIKEELHKQTSKNNDFEFAVGDTVFKSKGDYNLEGVVVGQFKMTNGAIRYVIEHEAKPKGSFCHIYSDTQLELVKKGT